MSDFEKPRREPSETGLVPTDMGAAVAARTTRLRAPVPPTGLVVFTGVLVLMLLSFGTAIALVSGATRSSTREAAASTNVPRVSGAPATAAPQVAAAVRILSANGRAELQSGTTYRVTFAWVLEGANQGDPAVIRVLAGGRLVSELRGALDQSVYSSGRLTIPASLECSADGWSAELVSVRSLPVVGDGTAKVAGVACR